MKAIKWLETIDIDDGQDILGMLWEEILMKTLCQLTNLMWEEQEKGKQVNNLMVWLKGKLGQKLRPDSRLWWLCEILNCGHLLFLWYNTYFLVLKKVVAYEEVISFFARVTAMSAQRVTCCNCDGSNGCWCWHTPFKTEKLRCLLCFLNAGWRKNECYCRHMLAFTEKSLDSQNESLKYFERD